ncbi:hypothetical protein B0H16DRAFT_1507700 [Mycena metata]|uniref:Uncharacterized protein n=1 Tax=Mycena metata TaxID=1033252 RepID=A0AAD7NTQ5_9AGAR|nr:hypothetical protein B0H16DRAFT_1507700 [Mycena metata]
MLLRPQGLPTTGCKGYLNLSAFTYGLSLKDINRPRIPGLSHPNPYQCLHLRLRKKTASTPLASTRCPRTSPKRTLNANSRPLSINAYCSPLFRGIPSKWSWRVSFGPPFVYLLVLDEQLFQNTALDAQMQAIGFLPAEPHIIVVVESENRNQFTEMLKDEAVQKLLKEAKESGLDNAKDFGLHTGAAAFAADVRPVKSFASPPFGSHFIGIYTVPQGLSVPQFGAKFETWLNVWSSLRVTEVNKVNYEVWEQTDAIDEFMELVGHSRAQPTFVLRLASKEVKDMITVLKDPEAEKIVRTVKQEVDFTLGVNIGVDVVTKLDRS